MERRQESLGGEEDVQERCHAVGFKPEQVKGNVRELEQFSIFHHFVHHSHQMTLLNNFFFEIKSSPSI